jgi:hypothetical protein
MIISLNEFMKVYYNLSILNFLLKFNYNLNKFKL